MARMVVLSYPMVVCARRLSLERNSWLENQMAIFDWHIFIPLAAKAPRKPPHGACTDCLVLHEMCLPAKQTRVFKHYMGAKRDAHNMCECTEVFKNRNENLNGK